MKYILLTLVLVGCAADNDPNPEPKTVTIIEQKPAPIEDAGIEDTTTCTITKSVRGGNCVVNLIKCSDGTSRLDSRCYPPDWEPPWKNLPDPPY